MLLYELLTGTTPVDRRGLGKAALLEILRIVREVEPPRPSTKLEHAATPCRASPPTAGTEPAKLAGLLRGELDWVVMKALEKDRARRYETANGAGPRHPALPGRRGGRGPAADGRLPAAEVRPRGTRGR